MTYSTALKEAKRAADDSKIPIVVVNAPIENAEEKDPYGYCPIAAKPLLYHYGTVEGIVLPTEEVGKFQARLIKRMEGLSNVPVPGNDPTNRELWKNRAEQVKSGFVTNSAFQDWLTEEATPWIEDAPAYAIYLSSLSGNYDLVVPKTYVRPTHRR